MRQILKRIVETLVVIFGNCIYAFGIAMFILPSGLITGGTTGVDEDEEALDLIKFQNAYNLSSKMISVMAEVYDKLIEETGV